jgi:hypothetical protein
MWPRYSTINVWYENAIQPSETETDDHRHESANSVNIYGETPL